MKEEIKKRIISLRAFMKRQGIAAFIIPSTDPHSGEYVPEHWETRKWISGFTGSAGTVVITEDKGGLWTDSRYFLQASEQLQDTGITLFKDRLPDTPTIAEWLEEVLHPGDKVGIDGWVNTVAEVESLRISLASKKLQLISVDDPFNLLWEDRPPLPQSSPFILPLEYSGMSCSDKLTLVRESLCRNQADGILISALDEIAWTLNLRGNDVHCNPVFISYLFITQTDAALYILPEKLTAEVKAYLTQNQIQTKDYTEIENDLLQYKGNSIQLSPETNYTLYQAASTSASIIKQPSPIRLLKAVKNETEIKGFHQAMVRDGVAMVRFLIWLKENVQSGMETELSVDRKLYELRSEQCLFQGISFDTIAGYQEHGAIVHYEATPETSSTLQAKGLLLLDSGAQYLDGTTDITRTIALGNLTEEEKLDYTLILKGHIALAMAVFPEGTRGAQLDVLARMPIWQQHMNYLHGTGHGVGHFLNVHEGPQSIRMNENPIPLQPGMITSNEPGVYKAGSHGIRTENLVLTVPAGEGMFGNYLKFETITLCPICRKGIIKELLTAEEIKWLNKYHQTVYEKLAPDLNNDEREWLKEACKAIITK